MKKALRICQVRGHQDFRSSHICTFQGCKQESRWACAEQARRHDQKSNNHMMNQQQFKTLTSQLSNINNEERQYLIEEIKQYLLLIGKLISQISQIEQYLQKYQKEIDDDQIYYQIQQLVDDNFYTLNYDQITQILSKQNLQQIPFNNQQLLENVQEIIRQSIEIEQQILKNSQYKKQQFINYFSFKLKDYAKFKSNTQIYSTQISSNEQYLAYEGQGKILSIIDLNQNKETQQFKLDYNLNVCRFSNDCKLLYAGCFYGYLYCIDIRNNYSQIYNNFIHKDSICNIIEQSNQVIITSAKTDIIITDIKLKQQILKIDNAHTDWINGLDYSKLDDLIVSGSHDKSIKLFYKQNNLLFNLKKQVINDNKIIKIQLIFNNKLLSLFDDGVLKCWQIDMNQGLLLLNQIQIKITFVILIMLIFNKQ